MKRFTFVFIALAALVSMGILMVLCNAVGIDGTYGIIGGAIIGAVLHWRYVLKAIKEKKNEL